MHTIGLGGGPAAQVDAALARRASQHWAKKTPVWGKQAGMDSSSYPLGGGGASGAIITEHQQAEALARLGKGETCRCDARGRCCRSSRGERFRRKGT